MSDDILPAYAFDGLSGTPEVQFLTLADIAETNRHNILSGSRSDNDKDRVQLEYMSVLQSVSRAFGFDGLNFVPTPPVTLNELSRFSADLAALKARLRLRRESEYVVHQIDLGPATTSRIRSAIDDLRAMITAADLPEKKRSSLLSKLDKLSDELNRRRVTFAQVATVMAAIATVIGGSSTALANAPKARETVISILQWFGDEAEAQEEDEERLRIAPPPKALPAPDAFEGSSIA